MKRFSLRRIAGSGLLVLLAALVVATAVAAFQGQRTPPGDPEYVALGSSFAAGAGLGPLEPGSPLLCARSINGYPQQLARLRGLSIVDMSCGGAMIRHLLDGGQVFQGPQIRTLSDRTRLVTITVGGNDIGYVGDLSLLAARKARTPFGWLVRRLWKGPRPARQRDYDGLRAELVATLDAIHERAPQATVVVATYPALVPRSGTCPAIGLTEAEAALMREVGDRLADTTRAAAREGRAVLVDMHARGTANTACSGAPWASGWPSANGAPFHPNTRGAEATARAIAQTVGWASAPIEGARRPTP